MAKKIFYLFFTLILFVTIVGCTNNGDKTLTSINVTNAPNQIEIGKFDEAGIQFELIYSDGTTASKDVKETDIPSEYQHYLYEEGTHSFTFLYRGCEVTLTITMYEVKYSITFLNALNEEVLKVSYIPNGELSYPTNEQMYTEGYRFLGTYDKDLSNITSDLTVKGNYVKVWTVEFYNGYNELISTQIVDEHCDAEEPNEEERQVEGYTFVSWDISFNNVTSNIKVFGIYVKETTNPVDDLYEMNEDKTEVIFGLYPQSKVTDEELISTLSNKIGTLPTKTYSYSWTSYGYYISESNETNFMWYQDIAEGDYKYRAVYFASYRPWFTNHSSSSSSTYQYDNGYYMSTVYYFRYDPIVWKVLTIDETNNKAFLFANIALDSQDYNYTHNSQIVDGNTIYANNYEYSTIRSWLNDNFYNTAFTKEEQQIILDTLVDNSASSTGYTTNNYACNDTTDKIFLLSYSEVTNSEYGFSSDYSTTDISRQLKSTDYAISQGCYQNKSSSYVGNCIWWLRSPIYGGSIGARGVNSHGRDFSGHVYCTDMGVVPALWISI